MVDNHDKIREMIAELRDKAEDKVWGRHDTFALDLADAVECLCDQSAEQQTKINSRDEWLELFAGND